MKRGWLKSSLRWGGRALLALLVLFGLFITEENIRGRILLARYKAELRAKGEKLMLAELDLPKPIENADYHVLLISAGELTDLSQAFAFGALESRCRLRFIGPACCMVRRLQPDTDMRLPNTGWYNRSVYYVYTWEELAEKVGLARQPLHAIRTILPKPVLAMSVDYRSAQIGAAQYKAAAAIGTWSTVAALSDLHQNDLDSALEDLLISTELIQSLQDSQSFELQMRRWWTGEAALDMTWEALQTPGWNDTQLARLQTAWEKASVIRDFEPSVEVQRADVLEHWNNAVHKPMRELLGWFQMSVLSWDDVSRFLGGIVWYAAWRQQDQARGVWLWAEGVDAFRAAVSAAKWSVARDIFKKTEREEWNLHWMFYDRWRYQMSIPDLPSATTWGPENLVHDLKRLLEYETRREMTVAAIALKRYELRYNKVAPALAALVPEFLAKVPHDYMDGGNLRYRLKVDSEWVLYSVGENCVDDDGDATSSEPRNVFFSIWDSRDAVWPAAATRKEVEAWETKWKR